MEKNVITFILGGIVVVLAVVLVYQYFGTGLPGIGGIDVLSKEEAGSRTIDFIRENFASPDIEMEILEIKETSGIY